MVDVICTCLYVHMSPDEKCNYSKHNGNSLLQTVTNCAVHNKYFIHTAACLRVSLMAYGSSAGCKDKSQRCTSAGVFFG